MQAVILAAGEGTRLRPLTQNRPKALLPVANRPILQHLTESLLMSGVRDIIVVVGYRKEQVMRDLMRLPVQVRVVEQKNQLGTAHALLAARHEIRGDVLVLPGDNYVDPASLSEILKVPDSMLITTHRHPSNFGVVTVDEGIVRSIDEKPARASRMTVSCGVYYLRKELLSCITAPTLTEAVNRFISDGVRITAVYAHEWQDAIYPWDLLVMNERLLRHLSPEKNGTVSGSAVIEGAVSIGRGTVVGPFTMIHGPVIIGEDCTIGPHAVIRPGTSIGSRVTIEPFTVVGNSLIMDDCTIASHSVVTSAVMGEACTLGEHSVITHGAGFLEMGEDAVRSACGVVMGNGVFSSPRVMYENSIIGNNSQITPRDGLSIRSQVIPDRSRVM